MLMNAVCSLAVLGYLNRRVNAVTRLVHHELGVVHRSLPPMVALMHRCCPRCQMVRRPRSLSMLYSLLIPMG